MSDSASRLPARPSLDQLRKQAKEKLTELRASQPSAKLADAQFVLAREYGFDSWPKLVRHVSAADPESSLPKITAPVSRHLGTSDVDRAIAFWRDVLGFEPPAARAGGAPVELVSGEARIQLGTSDWAPDFSGEARAPGAAIVFFQTSDVEAMHRLVRSRGGEPTDIEKVNWLKLRVFQLLDPDGHTLWFGQSYHSEATARPSRMIRQVMPELPLDDVPAGVRHYRDVLGFSVNYEQHDLGVMDRDATRVLLIARAPGHRGIGSAYFYVNDADALYAELLQNGADVQDAPASRPWGLREFAVVDPEGNRLTFGQPFE